MLVNIWLTTVTGSEMVQKLSWLWKNLGRDAQINGTGVISGSGGKGKATQGLQPEGDEWIKKDQEEKKTCKL